MQCPDIVIERTYNRGIHLDPSYPLIDEGTIINCYELILFTEDWAGGVVIDGVFHQAVANHFICCKPTQHRRYKIPVRCFAIQISTTDADLKAALNALPLCAFHPEISVLSQLHWEIYTVATRSTLTDRLSISSLCARFLQILLSRQYPLDHIQGGNPRRHQNALIAADQYLKDHLDEDVDLEKLARESHLHPTYFHKLFKEAFGRTPAQQLMYHRVVASREYLRDDNCTIGEIARKCGFSSQSYYCRKYKEISLESPSSFRNAIRKRRNK